MPRIIHYILSLALSSTKVFYLRLRGAHIGKRVLIGRVKFKTKPKNIIIGDGVVIGDGVIFDNLNSIELQDYVKIHKAVHVKNGTDGNARLFIGYNSWIGSETILDCERDIIIESNVGFGGSRSQLWTHGYFPSIADGYPSKLGEIVIKEGAWLASSCIILPNVKIGTYSIIGAGSVVTKSIPDRVLATGIPCKVKFEETIYRKVLAPKEKIDTVLAGCINNIEQKGGKFEQLNDHTWICTFLYKKFKVMFQQNPEDWEEKGDACVFTWDKPEQLSRIPNNISLFILADNSYTKKATLHEWIVVRALLDSCTLRFKPLIVAKFKRTSSNQLGY